MRLRSGTTYNLTDDDNANHENSMNLSPQLIITNNNKCNPICSQIDETNVEPLTILESVSALFKLKNVYCCGRAKNCQMNDRICCSCSDRRPHTEKYYAYNNPELKDVSEVSRSYYYCPKCVK
jgi:hypothetical protein